MNNEQFKALKERRRRDTQPAKATIEYDVSEYANKRIFHVFGDSHLIL